MMNPHYSSSRYVTRLGDGQRAWKKRSKAIVLTFFLGTIGSLVVLILLALIGSQIVQVLPSIATLCFVSAVFNLPPVVAFSAVLCRWRSGSQTLRSSLVYTSFGALLVSFVLNTASSGWLLTTAKSESLWSSTSALSTACIPVSTLAVIADIILLFVMFWNRGSSTQQQYIPNESLPEIAFINRPATSKTQTTDQSNPFSTQSGFNSPRLSISAISIHSMPSRKNSKTQSRPSSRLSEVSQLDFEWDTSGVPATLRDTVHRKLPSKLPPIPGSRPVSPAKALDGPFLPPSPHPNQSQPASPIDAAFSPTISEPCFEESVLLPPQLPFTEPSFQLSHSSSLTTLSTPKQISRCPSIISLVESVSHLAMTSERENKEANIHPLFRSSSGDTIPCASKKTILTAATLIDAEGVVSSNRSKVSARTSGKPTSPLANSMQWEPVRRDTDDSFVSLGQEKPNRPLSISSDIIILPSLPRSSTTSRPRASTECSDIRTESLLSTPPKAPSLADTVITKPSFDQKRQSKHEYTLQSGPASDALDTFHTGDLLVPEGIIHYEINERRISNRAPG